MKQQSISIEFDHLERKLKAQIETAASALGERIQTLEAPAFDATNFSAPPNYLPNSHPEYSTMAYGTAATTPATAGDTNRECHNWYRQTSATTTLAATAAAALKRSVSGAEHSLWAANEAVTADIPRWDGVNGTFLLGSSSANYDIACPLPTDFVFPGQTFYVYIEAGLASGSIVQPAGLQFYCGFWDNTAGQRKWIEGGDFTPVLSIFGAPGTRTLEYKILAKTDSGTEILSVAVSTTTAPAALSEENHVRLAFSGAPGFIEYQIYRKDGSVYRKVHTIRNSIDLEFYDMQETAGSIESGYPTASGNRPKAYAITQEFEPSSLSSAAFAVHTLTVSVPSTYDRSVTTNAQQWFRFGVDELMAAASERGIVIRRISVSEGYGGWARSALDLGAASSPTSTAASAPSGGNPTGDPPPGGSGGTQCVALDTLTEILTQEFSGDRVDTVKTIPFSELEKGMSVVCGASALMVKKTHTGTVQKTYLLRTKNGLCLRCTDTHRLVRSRTDTFGTIVRQIEVGSLVLTFAGGCFEQSEIIAKEEILGSCEVKSIWLDAPHLFTANGFVSHNLKPASV